MGNQPPVLEYARLDAGVRRDRYRVVFLMVAVAGIVALCMPIAGKESLAEELPRALRRVPASLSSKESLFVLALLTAFLAPVTLSVWRILRLLGEPWPAVAACAVGLAGLHLAGVLGLCVAVVWRNGWDERAWALMPIPLVIAGALFLVFKSWRRHSRSMQALLLLLAADIGFYVMVSLIVFAVVPRPTPWHFVLAGTTVAAGIEFFHVRACGKR